MTNRFHNTCIVIGNGPSLRGFDLHRLNNFTTLGMNAAYRHWDRIGWYPTYYCCLDDQLIKTHHAEVERLYAQNLVKKVFVHGSFFDYHPHRLKNEDFTSFDQTSSHWYNKKAKALGLEPLYDRPAFKTSDTSKITTGAHSIRYAANFGHDRIVLLGIDLKYVEILPEAEATSEIGLVIKKTPARNPNYFFDGYQKAGDLYNIPNPSVHGGELHPQSLELIPKDFSANSVSCTVYNGNRQSILSDRDVFPYVAIEEVTGENLLGSVMVPSNAGEIDLILANFKLWNTIKFSPSDQKTILNKPDLVFVFNNYSAHAHQDKIIQAFHTNGMNRFFRSVCFEYLDLEGDRDVYIRDYKEPIGNHGYKAGPNNQFFSAIRRIAPYGKYTFLMEVDCLPIRKGWLSRLQTLVNNSEPFWIMGSAYRGLEKLGKDNTRHLNGNAVYASGNPEFQKFVSDFWEHHTWRLIQEKDKRLAYDCILEIMFSQHNLQEQSVLDVWKHSAHQFRYSNFIQNTSGGRDIAETDESTISNLLCDSPETYILHNRTAHKIALMHSDAGQFENSLKPSNHIGYPKLLIIDMTAAGNGTATGEIKSNLLKDWPQESVLQISKEGTSRMAAVRYDGNSFATTSQTVEEARATINTFAPDVVLYRPTPNTSDLHTFALGEIDRLKKPVITWIMDDWPARMAAEDPEAWTHMEQDLHWLLHQSTLCLSICEAMSEAFVRRYATAFRPFANGIDPSEWPALSRPDRKMFIIRYAGGLAEDMNRESLLQVAKAVEELAASGLDIKFEISTQSWWKRECEPLFAAFSSTTIELANKTMPDYRRWISEADLLLIAYNFDEKSLLYTQYSMANKMPECLASGVPVLAYGPPAAATIDYLGSGNFAEVVAKPEASALRAAIQKLYHSPKERAALGAAGRQQAVAQHNINRLRKTFTDIIVDVAQTPIFPSHTSPVSDGLERYSKVLSFNPSPASLASTPILTASTETTRSEQIAARRLLIVAASNLLLGLDMEKSPSQAGPAGQQIVDALELLPETDRAARHYRKALKSVK